MCASTNSAFVVVGEPDASMDGNYKLDHTTNGVTTTTVVTLTGGIPTSSGSGDTLAILDGIAHVNPKDENTTYTGTGDAGRVGSSFTMQIVISYSNGISQKLTFTSTIDENGAITGEGSQTVTATGYNDVKSYTFTMTKQ
jgi:hypothetical protein